eukprot:645121-Rhodomonas_salina.1
MPVGPLMLCPCSTLPASYCCEATPTAASNTPALLTLLTWKAFRLSMETRAMGETSFPAVGSRPPRKVGRREETAWKAFGEPSLIPTANCIARRWAVRK